MNAVLSTDMFWDMVREGVDGANQYSLCSWGFSTLEPVSGGRKFAQYYVQWMNRRRSGKWLLDAPVTSPTYAAGPLGGDETERKEYGTVDGVPYLSAYATLSADGSRLFLIVTNKSAEPQPASLTLNAFTPRNRASVWQMTSSRWDDTGIQPAIFEISNAATIFSYAFPARSVTSFVFDVL